MVNYIPEQGDIVALNFDPQSGHEQKGRRPAIIISNQTFNQHMRLAFACPITNLSHYQHKNKFTLSYRSQ